MFETIVGQMVRTTLINRDLNTEWFDGTLFVSPINQQEAEQLQARFAQVDMGVVFSQLGDSDEYAVDFVAE